MDYLTQIFTLIITVTFTSNIVLNQSLGICPFLGVSKKMDSAVGMGLAVTFVTTIASVVCFGIFQLLTVLEVVYLQTLVFILIISSIVQLLDIILKKTTPSLYHSLGVYLALITTNCVVLGTVNFVVAEGYDLFQTFIVSFFTGIGFTLALVLMAGVRETFEVSIIPKPFKGMPIALIAAGLIAMAFVGLSGIGV